MGIAERLGPPVYLGHAPPSLAIPPETTGHEGARRRVTRRRAAGPGGPPRVGPAAPAPRRQRPGGRGPGTADAASDSEDRPSLRTGGLDRALYEKQRPGAAEVLARPRSNASSPWSAVIRRRARRWTVRLIVEEAVKRKLVPRAGRETIRILLQSHDLKPWREKNVVRG